MAEFFFGFFARGRGYQSLCSSALAGPKPKRVSCGWCRDGTSTAATCSGWVDNKFSWVVLGVLGMALGAGQCRPMYRCAAVDAHRGDTSDADPCTDVR